MARAGDEEDVEADPIHQVPSTLQSDDECVNDSPDGCCALSVLQRYGRHQGGMEAALAVAQERQLRSQDAKVTVSSFDELRVAVESSKTGAVIDIAEGSTIMFTSTISILQGKTFVIRSLGATLDGKNLYGQVRLFYVSGDLTLSGLSVQNGQTDYGGALYFDFQSKGTLSNCQFLNNEATHLGGAIAAKGATLELRNVSFDANFAKNTCLGGVSCSRRRRNSRKGNALYILSHTKLDASMLEQPRSQDFYFDNDFDGQATFHCKEPTLMATDAAVTRNLVHFMQGCPLHSSAMGA